MLYMFSALLERDRSPCEHRRRRSGDHFAFADEARSRGAYVASEAIGGTAVATTVHVDDGKTVITDGPFAEAKEVMGGFYILDCKDMDEALEFAAKIPETTLCADGDSAGDGRSRLGLRTTADYARQSMG